MTRSAHTCVSLDVLLERETVRSSVVIGVGATRETDQD